MITFESVTKRYPGGTVAVDSLDLEVPGGQTMVLVGPSGCGKTTTLRMINRLIDPTSGRILLDGQDIQQSNPSALRRGIGYVIQQAGLFPHRTIEDNIGTVPLLIGWGKARARARARELMGLVGLDEDLARRYPHQLSGGQQQRVGVARALAADPPVLLMDEPFSAVDPIVRATLQDELLRLQAELHKTVVLVTHDVEEAIKVGDQVAIFRPGGKIAQLDTPERLLAAPADGYVENFLGFDRGIRRLSFLAASGLSLDDRAVVGEDTSASVAADTARRAGEEWVLVTDAGHQPRGWAAASDLETMPSGSRAGQARLEPYGHTFDVRTDSLRAALDATVLSPTGRAVGVDDERPGGRGDLLRAAAGRDPRRGAGRAGPGDPGRRPGRAGGRAGAGPRPGSGRRVMIWSWIPQNAAQIRQLTLENAYLGIVPALIGLVISLPLGIACARWRWLYRPGAVRHQRAVRAAVAGPVHRADPVHRPDRHHGDHPAHPVLALRAGAGRGGRDAVGPGSGPPGRHGHGVRHRCGAWSRSSSRSPCPGRDRRASGGHGVEHQPGQRRPADRRQQPRATSSSTGTSATSPRRSTWAAGSSSRSPWSATCSWWGCAGC